MPLAKITHYTKCWCHGHQRTEFTITWAVQQPWVDKRLLRTRTDDWQRKTTSLSHDRPAATKLSGAGTAAAGYQMLATISYPGHSFSIQKRNRVSTISLLTLTRLARKTIDGREPCWKPNKINSYHFLTREEMSKFPFSNWSNSRG